jgi:hypothetical protein
MSRLLPARLVGPRLLPPRLVGGPGALANLGAIVVGTARVADRVGETTLSSGLGTIDLNGAVAGYQSFVDGIGDGLQTYYCIVARDTGQWETGVGTVSKGMFGVPNRLARDTVVDGSGGAGVRVNFLNSATPKDVFSTVVAAVLNKVFVGQVATPTYAAVVTVDARQGRTFTITATNTSPWALVVANAVAGQEIALRFRNTSGGVMGTITMPTTFRLAGAWVNPANSTNRVLVLTYDPSGVWYEVSRSPADIPN